MFLASKVAVLIFVLFGSKSVLASDAPQPPVVDSIKEMASILRVEYAQEADGEAIVLWHLLNTLPCIDNSLAAQFPIGAPFPVAAEYLKQMCYASGNQDAFEEALIDMMMVPTVEEAFGNALLWLHSKSTTVKPFLALNRLCYNHPNPLLKAINLLRTLGGKYFAVFNQDPRLRFKSFLTLDDIKLFTGSEHEPLCYYRALAKMHGLSDQDLGEHEEFFSFILQMTIPAMEHFRRKQVSLIFR